MAEEDIESLTVPEKSELGIAMGKPSSSDKKCAYGESSVSVDNKECSRQNSTGKPSISKKNQKISPNYLRASTGSCHDFCKYGIKHGFEHEEKRPWRKKIALTSSGKKNCVVTVALPERRKSMVARSVSFPVNKSLLQDEVSSGAVISPHPPEIIKREISLPRNKNEESSKPERTSERTMLKKGKRMTDFSKEQSPSAMRQPSSYASVQSGRNTKKDETRMSYSSPKIPPPLHSKQVKAGLSSSVARLQPVKARLSSSMQIEGSIKETIKSSNMKSDHLRHSIQAAGGPNGSNKKSEVKISEVNTKLSSSTQSARTVNERGKRNDNIKTRNNTAAFSSAAKQTLASHRPSISGTTAIKPKKVCSLKVVSPLKDQNRMQKTEIGKTSDENVPEKTLHVVEVETNAKLSESAEAEAWDITPTLSPRSNFSPAHEEVEVWGITPHFPQSNLSPVLSLQQGMSLSDHEEVSEAKPEAGKEDAGGDEVKEEEKEQLHREELEEEEEELEEEMETEEDSDDGEEEEYNDESDDGGEFISGNETFNYDDLSAVEGNNCKPLKKGYVISDSRDSEQVKLKFRRGKVLDIQSENKGPRRLRFRRARIVEESQGSKNETNRRNFSRRDITKGNSDSTGDEKIVLRHQDLQGKKDAQGSLLNIVLEETASKLVETRKSKVKALVGAFETVISLHDSKPSAQPVA